MPAVKKAKRKAQHEKAIKEYEVWLKKNPKAPDRVKFETFDMYVDSSELPEILHATS